MIGEKFERTLHKGNKMSEKWNELNEIKQEIIKVENKLAEKEEKDDEIFKHLENIINKITLLQRKES